MSRRQGQPSTVYPLLFVFQTYIESNHIVTLPSMLSLMSTCSIQKCRVLSPSCLWQISFPLYRFPQGNLMHIYACQEYISQHSPVQSQENLKFIRQSNLELLRRVKTGPFSKFSKILKCRKFPTVENGKIPSLGFTYTQENTEDE